jgi:hypothetical protein
VLLALKDVRVVRLTFDQTSKWIVAFTKQLQGLVFPEQSYLTSATAPCFALNCYSLRLPSRDMEGWQLYSPREEFRRQGIFFETDRGVDPGVGVGVGLDGSSSNLNFSSGGNTTTSPTSTSTPTSVPSLPPWRLFEDNYVLCDTYPAAYLVPAEHRFSDADLAEVASFRSRGRLPVVTWMHPTTGALLVRSSQPQVGLSGRRCDADEQLLDLYRLKGGPQGSGSGGGGGAAGRDNELYIVDARGQVAAEANKMRRKGYENAANYGHNCAVVFCNIGNIHVMRDSLTMLRGACSPGGGGSGSGRGGGGGSGRGSGSDQHHAKLAASGWLKHLQLLVKASVHVARMLELSGATVLVHCSDGRDRTPQLCATAQLLLDPYYRTIRGFCVLVEKEWCSFGHMFHKRHGHHEDKSKAPSERSPCFAQWLDVVAQVVMQSPSVFEFTDELLVFLADHSYSCLFGECVIEFNSVQFYSILFNSIQFYSPPAISKLHTCKLDRYFLLSPFHLVKFWVFFFLIKIHLCLQEPFWQIVKSRVVLLQCRSIDIPTCK